MSTLFVEKLEQNDEGTWGWVPRPVNIDDADFEINELELSAEICRQGKLMVKYGELAAELGAELQRKEEALKYTKAKIASLLRTQAEAAGQKITQGNIDDQVVMHQSYQTALAQLHVLRANEAKANHYWRSISKKADLLNALAFRQNAEIRKGY